MNRRLLQPEVQEFLSAQADRNPAELALSGSPFAGISASELAAQLDGRKRSKGKLPTWQETAGIYYPGRLNIEQTSSEATARYKASLIPSGCRLLDMTGGLGVDSYYFSQRAAEVTYCELDPLLGAIAAHNFIVLDANNVICRFGSPEGDGIVHLANSPAGFYDLVYLDPGRRSGSQKVFMLRDCQPDILSLQSLLLEKSPRALLKLSPMLDIQATLGELNHVAEIHVVSLGGECKELLFRLDRDHEGPVQFTAIALARDGSEPRKLAFTLEEERNAEADFGHPAGFLYEPDAALLKAGAFRYTALYFGLTKIAQHTHLYTSDRILPNFPGKISKIQQVTPYSVFKKNNRQLSAGNVIAKNFPIRAEELRKKHRIGEHPNLNIYFCREQNGELNVILSNTLETPGPLVTPPVR